MSAPPAANVGKHECRGSCLNQCTGCTCFQCSICGSRCMDDCDCDEDTPVNYDEICACGHRGHAGYCPPVNPCASQCVAVPCPNSANHEPEDRSQRFPQWYLDCHGGNCQSCAMTWGKRFLHTEKIQECPVCFNDTLAVKLGCGHELCWKCWDSICSHHMTGEAPCPICRQLMWRGKDMKK